MSRHGFCPSSLQITRARRSFGTRVLLGHGVARPLQDQGRSLGRDGQSVGASTTAKNAVLFIGCNIAIRDDRSFAAASA